MIGAFQGAIPRMTPTGSRKAIARQPGLSEGITSPAIWVVSAAASRTIDAASMRLNNAHPLVAPISPIIASTNASVRAVSASAAFVRIARRAFGPMAAHAGKASAACLTIAGMSAACIAAAVEATWPVSGFKRSKFFMATSLI